MALASVWVFPLLAVVHGFTGGGWLVGVGFPLAALGVAFLWAYFLCLRYLRAGPWGKADFRILAQLKAGDKVRFAEVSVEEAQLRPWSPPSLAFKSVDRLPMARGMSSPPEKAIKARQPVLGAVKPRTCPARTASAL